MQEPDRKPADDSAISLAGRALAAVAADYCGQRLDAKPTDPLVWVKYGHALREAGQLEEAETAYRMALSIDWTVADAHLQLGQVLTLQGKKDDAETSYLRAFALDPSVPGPFRELRASTKKKR
jgi:Flp pilus assembly protein TadD